MFFFLVVFLLLSLSFPAPFRQHGMAVLDVILFVPPIEAGSWQLLRVVHQTWSKS